MCGIDDLCLCYKLCCKINETWEWDRKKTLRFDVYTNTHTHKPQTNTHTHTFTHRFIGRCFFLSGGQRNPVRFLIFLDVYIWRFPAVSAIILSHFPSDLLLFLLSIWLIIASMCPCCLHSSFQSTMSGLHHITCPICLLACSLTVTILLRKTGGVCLIHVPSSLPWCWLSPLSPPSVNSQSSHTTHKLRIYTSVDMYTCTMTMCTNEGETQRAQCRVHVCICGWVCVSQNLFETWKSSWINLCIQVRVKQN